MPISFKSNNRITISGIDIGFRHTISFWIRPQSPGVEFGTIFSNFNDAIGVWITGSNDAANYLKLNYGIPANTYSTSTLSNLKWNHVLVSLDGSNSGNFFFNGISAGSIPTVAGSTVVNIAGGSTATAYPLRADLDEFCIYAGKEIDGTQTVERISNSKVRGMPLQLMGTSNLKLYFPMDDFSEGVSCSGVIKDRSGSNNNGTFVGSINPVAIAGQVLSYQP